MSFGITQVEKSALPDGAATEATIASVQTGVVEVRDRIIAPGRKAASGSHPLVLASEDFAELQATASRLGDLNTKADTLVTDSGLIASRTNLTALATGEHPDDATLRFSRVRPHALRSYVAGAATTPSPTDNCGIFAGTTDSIAGATALTTAFMEGTRATFDTTAQYIYGFFDGRTAGSLGEPVAAAQIMLVNGLSGASAVTLTVQLWGIVSTGINAGEQGVLLASTTVGPFFSRKVFSPLAPGSAATNHVQVPDLGSGLYAGWMLKITADVDPTGGQMQLAVNHGLL